jgi:hypothetical protein
MNYTENKNIKDIATVTESGTPVKERVSSIESARALFEKCKTNDLTMSVLRARWKGMNDGNPPYIQARLDELGLGYMTNFNSMEMRAILEQKAGAFYELFFEVPTQIEVKQVFGLDTQTPGPNYGDIIAEEYSTLMLNWPGYLVCLDKSRRQSDLYGYGVAGWPDSYDWRPTAFETGNFCTDPLATVEVDKLPYFMIRANLYAGELLKYIEDKEAAVKAGWNVTAVEKLLAEVYVGKGQQSTDKYQTSLWEEAQRRIRNNDWTLDNKDFEPVKVVFFLIKEVFGEQKVSRYIFSEAVIPGADAFLFKKQNEFECMRNVLWLLPYNNADTYLRSCRGLAAMIEQHCDLSNRFLGNVFDAGRTISSLLLQPTSVMDLSKLQLVRMGIVTIIPPGLNTLQSTFQPQISPLIQLRDLSSNIMRNNNGVYRQHSELFAESQAQKTAYQVSQEVAKEARLEKTSVAYDLECIERLHREIFRRLTNPDYILSEIDYPGKKEALKFIGKCVLRGVPLELLLLQDAWEIYATRPIGLGSWGVKLDLTNQLMQPGIISRMDERGQVNAFRDYLAVRFGYRNVDRYKPIVNRDTVASNESSIAALENNDFLEGATIPVGSDQTHVLHLATHGQIVAGILQAVSQTDAAGMDVNKALGSLSAALPHMEKHAAYLAQDPSRQETVKQVMDLITQGVAVYKKLQKYAQQLAQLKRQQEQQNANTVSAAQQVLQNADAQIKLYEIEKKAELERIKQESLNAMRKEKTDSQMEIRREQAAQDLKLKADRQMAELQMNALVTDAKVGLMSVKKGV